MGRKVMRCPDCGNEIEYSKGHLHQQCPECGQYMKVHVKSESDEDD